MATVLYDNHKKNINTFCVQTAEPIKIKWFDAYGICFINNINERNAR